MCFLFGKWDQILLHHDLCCGFVFSSFHTSALLPTAVWTPVFCRWQVEAVPRCCPELLSGRGVYPCSPVPEPVALGADWKQWCRAEGGDADAFWKQSVVLFAELPHVCYLHDPFFAYLNLMLFPVPCLMQDNTSWLGTRTCLEFSCTSYFSPPW